MDTGLDENETELGVLVLAVALKMLADLDGLLDEHVQILGDLGGEAVGLEDADDLLAGDGLDLGDAVGVTEDDADLGGGEALLGELADVLLDLLGGDLEPRGGSALVGASGLGDALSGCVKTAHAVLWRNRLFSGGEKLSKTCNKTICKDNYSNCTRPKEEMASVACMRSHRSHPAHRQARTIHTEEGAGARALPRPTRAVHEYSRIQRIRKRYSPIQ